MEAILGVLPFIVLCILLWITYVNVSFGVTIQKSKKRDTSLTSCLSTSGRYFYIALLVVYSIALVGAIIMALVLYLQEEIDVMFYILNGITLLSIGISFLLQQIIFVGQKQILIGKVLFDYRKMKRVTYPKASKMCFVYGQRQYNTTLWFIDMSILKKAMQRAR